MAVHERYRLEWIVVQSKQASTVEGGIFENVRGLQFEYASATNSMQTDDWNGQKTLTLTKITPLGKDNSALPAHEQIIVANGAAHSFKFASLIGRILNELAIAGHTQYPIEAFTVDRPALTDPNFPCEYWV